MDTKNALSETQINEWKQKYRKIYKSVVGDSVVIFRKLNRAEYVNIMSHVEDDDAQIKIYKRQDAITEAATLYPENVTELVEENAGFASLMADEILTRSGFNLVSTTEL